MQAARSSLILERITIFFIKLKLENRLAHRNLLTTPSKLGDWACWAMQRPRLRFQKKVGAFVRFLSLCSVLHFQVESIHLSYFSQMAECSPFWRRWWTSSCWRTPSSSWSESRTPSQWSASTPPSSTCPTWPSSPESPFQMHPFLSR